MIRIEDRTKLTIEALAISSFHEVKGSSATQKEKINNITKLNNPAMGFILKLDFAKSRL